MGVNRYINNLAKENNIKGKRGGKVKGQVSKLENGKQGKNAKKLTVAELRKSATEQKNQIASKIENQDLKNAFNKIFNEGIKQVNSAVRKNKIAPNRPIFAQGKRRFNNNKVALQQRANEALNNRVKQFNKRT